MLTDEKTVEHPASKKRERPRKLSRAKKTAFSLATVIGFFLVLEGALRLFLFRYDIPLPSLIVWTPGLDKELVNPRHTFRFHRGSFWEPRPNAEYFDLNVHYGFINATGFRGPVVPVERTAAIRVACFGDSSTFGMLVDESESYPRQLEERLESLTGKRVEVLNAGVIGYSVYQGLARYRSRVRPYRPDLVTISFGAINDGLPAAQFPDLALAEHTQRIWSYESLMLRPLSHLRIVQLAYWLAPTAESDAESRRTTVSRSITQQAAFERHEPYVPRLSVAEFGRVTREFIVAARQDGAKVILISPPRERQFEAAHQQFISYSNELKQIGDELEVPLIDVHARFLENSSLFIDNVHPSPAGHRVIADMLAERIASLFEDRTVPPR